nr:iron-containing redox enzyme family protein [Brevibacterium sp. XM4083]
MSAALLAVLTHEETEADRDSAAALWQRLDEAAPVALRETADIVADEDLQLSLFLLHLLHTGPAPFVRGDVEWDPRLIALRRSIEEPFEAALRERTATADPEPTSGEEVSEALFAMTAEVTQPTLATWASRHATADQLREFLIHKSIYTLREADPHSWAIPRLRGRAKAALVEIQADEYGGGAPDRVHAEIFARTMRGYGLSDEPDHYLDEVPALTLAALNAMNLFGLSRRLRGATIGHLAAFEMTSSIPNRLYSRAFSRHGYGADVTEYFDEHVEADAVHEQIAGRDLAGGAADDDPSLIADILFGARACLHLDELTGTHMLESWQNDRTSLRAPTVSEKG